ncbi:flagellar protein FliT [Scandinavium goeteborgense]|uniref:Flagellar protein FliT n=1 Tax=Scandinavium goeteborgense TaxID=1851514 RepID=A0A4R6EKS9_SCAGO|nr:flagellar protein FliT [Scandinavium goeteborgense]TDN59441.1 protein FliT [Scandinavium goeteborgense]
MDNAVVVQLEELLTRNHTLFELAEQEAWDVFADEVEAYSARLKTMVDVDFTHLESTEREMAAQLLETLLIQDARLRQCIQARLNTLSGEMSSLRKNRRSAHAYTAV